MVAVFCSTLSGLMTRQQVWLRTFGRKGTAKCGLLVRIQNFGKQLLTTLINILLILPDEQVCIYLVIQPIIFHILWYNVGSKII